MSDSFQRDTEIRHYGVMGMKWGKTRAKATSKDIRTARKNVGKRIQDLMDAEDARDETTKGTPERVKAEAKYKQVDKAFDKDPDRVIANRMTRGEKAAALIIGGPLGLIPIAGTSAMSRRIERKQDLGKYDK